MELNLTFSQGILKGEGRDRVGDFVLTGKYTLADGKCHWHKRYVGKHDVYYRDSTKGRGIWGVWEIPADSRRRRLSRWIQYLAGRDEPIQPIRTCTRPSICPQLSRPAGNRRTRARAGRCGRLVNDLAL